VVKEPVFFNHGQEVTQRRTFSMAGIRAFVAIELSEEALEELERLQKKLKEKVPPDAVRWVRPQSIHLTLQFLGDVEPDRVEAIAGALREICRDWKPFTFEMKELGVFPNPRQPRVVWVGIVEPSGALASLQKRVTEALMPLGFEPEKRPFTPHLTLGRASRYANRRALAEAGELVTRFEAGSLGRIPVNRIVLMQSDLKPSGAVYTPLAILNFLE
jgi:2'-5' RNA ligase